MKNRTGEKKNLFLAIPLRELVPDLEANGLNAAGSELWLGGVEATAVDSHHLHDHRVNTALRDSHQVYQGCLNL
jgi:pyrroloquinoline quinone (PQQ) biosynthesis protein C